MTPPEDKLRIGTRRWGWAFWICAAAVLVLSLAPTTPDLPGTSWDKSNHLLAFVALTVTGMLAWPARHNQLLAALLLFGALIEVLQSFTGYRYAEWSDWFADGLGILLGYALAMLLRQLSRCGSR